MRANIGPVEKGGISSPRFGTEEQPKINFSGLHSLSLPFFFLSDAHFRLSCRTPGKGINRIIADHEFPPSFNTPNFP